MHCPSPLGLARCTGALLSYFSIRKGIKFSSDANERVPSHLSLQFPLIHILFSEHDYSLQVLKHPGNTCRLLCNRTASPWSWLYKRRGWKRYLGVCPGTGLALHRRDHPAVPGSTAATALSALKPTYSFIIIHYYWCVPWSPDEMLCHWNVHFCHTQGV